MIHRPLPCQECGLPSLTVIDFVSLNSTQNLLMILDKKLDTVLEETCEVGDRMEKMEQAQDSTTRCVILC